MKCMAVKDDTVHLINEVNYSGNFKEKPWHSNTGIEGALEGQLVTHPSTFTLMPRRPHDIIKEAMIKGLSLKGIYSNINTRMTSTNLWRKQSS